MVWAVLAHWALNEAPEVTVINTCHIYLEEVQKCGITSDHPEVKQLSTVRLFILKHKWIFVEKNSNVT